MGRAVTDDLGNFCIANLPPGPYCILAGGLIARPMKEVGLKEGSAGAMQYRNTFYPGTPSLKASRRANGYRHYSPDALVRLHIIISAQRAGFALEDISVLLPSKDAGWRGNELLSALLKKVDDMKAMQKRLSQTRKQIEPLITSIQIKPEGLTCAENANRVLTRLKSVTFGEHKKHDQITGFGIPFSLERP